ncbi:sensor histidine kinase [Kineococcus sp. NUM-3379]
MGTRGAAPARAAGALPWLLLCLAGGGLVLLGTSMLRPGDGERPLDAAGYGLVALACAALAAARWRPVAAAAVVVLAVLAHAARQHPEGPVLLVPLAVPVILAWRRRRRAAYAVAVVTTGVVVGAGALLDGGVGALDVAFAGWAAAAVLGADAARGARERTAARQAREELLARARELQERRRLAEERLQLARDLHDTVGHAMATITVQAAVAARALPARPEVAREALESVRAVSSTVLDELGALVRVLRDGPAASPLDPAPGLVDLPELALAAEQAGTRVELHVAPLPGPVPGSVQLAVYRVVQESLTNVSRHAPGARARVAVAPFDTAGLWVAVVDDGPAPGAAPGAARGPGAGVRGMRERAEATGGVLSAGPRAGGGFEVTACWPAAVAAAGAPAPVPPDGGGR